MYLKNLFSMENEQSSNIKRFEFASEQPQPQEQTLTSEERIIAAFKKENNELHKQLDSLEKKFDVMAEALAGAVAMLKIGVKKYPKAPKCHFPIKSKVELEAMNNAICEELIEFYTTKVNNILGTAPSLPKCLKNVLDEEVLLEYNLDGRQERAP
ncbi:uncharacterized protein LOC111081943 isoform X2 [Drosophila obscura]|uniref:uncharacterized protein LOC111081943 isoform X2 n=1 Tax=Drosophila obscura TaxID=7282 RepID=UPI001BB15E33|nr:uncharacterized protein LOC111081943 isoform X2 [Drosophila obscura]